MPVTQHHYVKRANRCQLVLLSDTQFDEHECNQTLLIYGSIKKLQFSSDSRAAFVEFECEHAPLLVARCFLYHHTNPDVPMPKGLTTLLPGCSVENFLYLHVPRTLSAIAIRRLFAEWTGLDVTVYRAASSYKSSTRAVVELRGQVESFTEQQTDGQPVPVTVVVNGTSHCFHAIPHLPQLTDTSDIYKKAGCKECNLEELRTLMQMEERKFDRASTANQPDPNGPSFNEQFELWQNFCIVIPEDRGPFSYTPPKFLPAPVEEQWDDVPVCPAPSPLRTSKEGEKEYRNQVISNSSCPDTILDGTPSEQKEEKVEMGQRDDVPSLVSTVDFSRRMSGMDRDDEEIEEGRGKEDEEQDGSFPFSPARSLSCLVEERWDDECPTPSPLRTREEEEKEYRNQEEAFLVTSEFEPRERKKNEETGEESIDEVEELQRVESEKTEQGVAPSGAPQLVVMDEKEEVNDAVRDIIDRIVEAMNNSGLLSTEPLEHADTVSAIADRSVEDSNCDTVSEGETADDTVSSVYGSQDPDEERKSIDESNEESNREELRSDDEEKEEEEGELQGDFCASNRIHYSGSVVDHEDEEEYRSIESEYDTREDEEIERESLDVVLPSSLSVTTCRSGIVEEEKNTVDTVLQKEEEQWSDLVKLTLICLLVLFMLYLMYNRRLLL